MTTPRRNIEVKARCADLGRARRLAEAAGARFVHVEAQRDTFFPTAHGRLKLRERTWRDADGQVVREEAELIGYHREDVAGVRESRYTVVPVIAPAALTATLATAWGLRGAVVKQRELWMWKNVRIHLDAVEQLGDFVEFEAVLGEHDTEEEGHARVSRLFAALELGAIVPVAYADLLGI